MREREVGRCKGFDLWLEDHGMLVLAGIFSFEGAGQGFGFQIDMDFIRGLMGVFNAEFFKQLEGKACWVTHDNSNIYLVEPLMRGEGKPFNVEEWAKTRK